MRLRVLLVLTVIGGAVGVPAAAARAASDPASCVARKAPISIGLSERSRSTSGRVVTIRLRSKAMAGDQTVAVLLPEHFDRSGTTRYRVLYLLHGAGGDHRTWLDVDKAEALLGDLPVIAVMPDGSATDASGQKVNGGYTDWFGLPAGSPGVAPAWESFHVRELVPFIDRAFPTRASPAGRAIAGISMGGSGAMKYAGEFPGTFGYAASFSGGLDSIPGGGADCKWGAFPRQEVVWRDNNPTALAANLRGVRLFVRSGDGTPGPFDPPVKPEDPGEAAVWQGRLTIEAGAHALAEHFLAAARRVGVATIDARFFPGSHSHPYWQRDFDELVAWLRLQFADPPLERTAFSVSSAHESFTAWGWSFATHRRVREFLYVRAAANRLTLTGSGRVDVRSPPRYRPRSRYRLRLGRTTRHVRADASGRVSFTVDLGPSHARRQTRFDADATKRWRRASARITADRLARHPEAHSGT
jgi:diacylglycerol O-acyltransferase/trehalose O-mycolyltransferase